MNSVSFEQFGLWVACGLIALDIYIRWAGLQEAKRERATTISGQPLEVKEAPGFVTQAECQRLHVSQDERVTKLEDEAKKAGVMAGESRARLYDKIEETRKELTGEIARVHKRIDNLEAEMRAMPGTIVRMIKEAREL